MKATYGRGKPAVGAAKAHVAYLVHRPDAWGNRQYRDLWGTLEVDKRPLRSGRRGRGEAAAISTASC